MNDMILISKKELDLLREKKSVEVTLDDLGSVIENKDLFVKWLKNEKLLYQVKLGNLEFVGNEAEANYSILCLKKTIERLENIDKAVDEYNKKESKKQA